MAGLFQELRGKDRCDDCVSGKFSQKGQSSCNDCVIGTYANEPATAIACDPCLAGQYSDEKGQSQCKLCDKGYKKESPSTALCTFCDSGTYSDQQGAYNCSKCKPNTRQHAKGTTFCTDCAPGRFVDEGSSATVCTPPAPQDVPVPPGLTAVYPGDNVTKVVIHVSIDTAERKTLEGQDKAMKNLVVEWCASADFAPVATITKMFEMPKDLEQNTMELTIDMGEAYLTKAWFFRVRYLLRKDGWVSKANPAGGTPRWHTIGIEDTSCTIEQYLRLNDNDDKTLPFLPLYMECTPRKCLQAWSRDGPLRRCMSCPPGAHCTSEEGQFGVVSYNVRPKWGYWRIPWAIGKPLNETFVACDGDEDCLGAPMLSSDIVFREIIGLGPSIPGQEDYQYRMKRRCNELPDDEVAAALACCASAMDSDARRLCEHKDQSDCICIEERDENNTVAFAKLERCQEGRVPDSVNCAVCQPEFMRTRGGCVKCYETETRVVFLVIGIVLFIVLIIIGRKCWSKLFRYRTALRDVMRIMIIIINLQQISNSLPLMIPIEWPGIWLDFKEYFEWADLDIMSLSGTTCVKGVNYYFTFAAMGTVPYLILFLALMFFFYQKITLNHRLRHMPLHERKQRHEDAYLEAFLIGDKDGNGLLDATELAILLNHELSLDTFKKGKYKIDPQHALLIIRKVSNDPKATEMPLMMFLDAMEQDTLNRTINEVCDLPIKHKDSGKDAMLTYIVKRGLFASSFMIATHMLLLAHSPVSKKVFIYYLCRDIGGRSFIRSDYSIECYKDGWNRFEPAVMFVLVTFTVGFPMVLVGMLYRNRKRLYKREIYAKMGFLYERYVRGAEWWEIHEMMRKVTLTGLLLFASDRPMVRAVLATLVCCIMIVNLNYFQPHRNLIVFWVEQLANLSATVKYLFAVVIAAGSGGGAGTQAAHLDTNDTELLGTLLIILDSCVYGFSLLAVLFILINVHTSLKKVRLQEKENRELAASTGDGRSHAIARRLSKTQVQPQPNRRASLRLEKPSERGMSAMIAHANDHVQSSKTKKMFGVGGGGGLKNLVLNAHKKHQTHSAVDKAEHDHDETLARHEQEIKKKSIDAHDRLTRRLIKRKSYSASNNGAVSGGQKKNVPKNSFGRKELPKGAGKKGEGDDEVEVEVGVEVEVEVQEEEEKGKHKQQKRSLLPNPAVELKFNAKK